MTIVKVDSYQCRRTMVSHSTSNSFENWEASFLKRVFVPTHITRQAAFEAKYCLCKLLGFGY
eukprot:4908390-Amphidinium_carterae.1